MDAWYHKVVKGDFVYPDPSWNRSSRLMDQLDEKCKVYEVIHTKSQSNVVFKVKTRGSKFRELDAGWFTGKQED